MTNKNISSPTATRIFAEWQKQGRAERARTYLGASIIGHECDMYLWLMFRGVVRENFDGRMYRLFDRGKREEAVFCADLRRIGCEVKEFDEHGAQWAVNALGGHFSGHLDGLCRGLSEAPKQWFVTEFKTHSDSSFKKLCKEGVAKAKPMHFAQMQVYMGHTGLKKALYMAVNKDNDDLWIEVINFDKAIFDQIMLRAKHIIDTVQPDRCATRQDDYRCKACPCASVCWHTADTFIDPSIPETCRTCCYSTADTEHEGACWVCSRKHSCTTDGVCDDYMPLPVFVKGEVVEGDDNGILYSFEINGNTDSITIGKRGISVAEAKSIGPNEKKSAMAIKEAFPESVASVVNPIELKFTGNDYEPYLKNATQEELQGWSTDHRLDLSTPLRTEQNDTKMWCEYRDDWCIVFDNLTNKLSVYGLKMPF